MASRALESFDFDDAMLSDRCAYPAEQSVMREFSSVPRGQGLMAAKGALVAIGLEAAAAFCLFGIWQVWRLFR